MHFALVAAAQKARAQVYGEAHSSPAEISCCFKFSQFAELSYEPLIDQRPSGAFESGNQLLLFITSLLAND